MGKIYFFYRCPHQEMSIERVFDSVYNCLKNKCTIDKVYVPKFRARPWDVVQNLMYSFSHRGHLNHITGDIHYCALALPGKKTILTIHDLVSLDYANQSKFKVAISYWWWYYLPIKHVKYVTCISQATKTAMLKYFPWAESKIHVICNPVSPDFKYIPKEFNATNPIILHIGTRQNKNLERVIEALADVHCHLRIIGRLSPNQQQLLAQYALDYSNVFNISDHDIIVEYTKCDLVSFPSLYEGFGMPIIEAFATGRAVLTSRQTPMNEVASGAAYLVDPYNVQSIRAGFETLIHNERQRSQNIQHGLLVAESYNVDTISNQYMQLYQQIDAHIITD